MPDSVTLGHLASNNTVGELTDAQMVRSLRVPLAPPFSASDLFVFFFF